MKEFKVYDCDSQTLNVAKQERVDDDGKVEIGNKSNLRTGNGQHIFTRDDYVQKYEGQFLYNNIHGQGKYTWLSNDGNGYILEDSFYANKIEGYSSIYYKDAGLFEGLFKSNRRYGPGVFTNENGTQDVGLWDGLSLIRLSCQVYNKWIPKLAQTEFGKIKLLKYRKLVPLNENKIDKKLDILTKLNAPETLLTNSHLLYNEYVTNENSLFFDKELYDELFFGKQDYFIDVISNDIDQSLTTIDKSNSTTEHYNTEYTSPNSEINYLMDNYDYLTCECELCEEEEIIKTPEDILNEKRKLLKEKYLEKHRTKCKFSTEKIFVTNILAWNNEKHLIDMLRYCFRFRNMEENVTFNVQSLLQGLRSHFKKTGIYEEICKQFLINCSEDNHLEILEFSNNYYINPDLCDSKGNTGIMYGAARDRKQIIESLVHLGANVDFLNDEGLTPLTMTILRYIAVLNDIKNWEKAFINNQKPNEDEEKIKKNWRPNCSLIYLLNSISKTQQLNLSQQSLIEQIQNLNIDLNDNIKEEFFTDLTKRFKGIGDFINVQEAYDTIYDNTKPQDYIFDTDCLKINLKKGKKDKKEQKGKKGKKEKKKKKDKKSKKERKTKSSEKSMKASPTDTIVKEIIPKQLTEEEKKKEALLSTIKITIRVLLRCGADPNIGEVPFPPLILSIFTKDVDILQGIINNKAHINIRTVDDHLTALHVLVSLKPPLEEYVVMLKSLLDKNADPNLRTNDSHWKEEKNSIIGKQEVKKSKNEGKTSKTETKSTVNFAKTTENDTKTTENDTKTSKSNILETNLATKQLTYEETKNPLHIISMRYDYNLDQNGLLNKMATLLTDYGCYIDDKYLGHTPLTLAMLRGNVNLIETLLINGANPNIKLGYNMGVPSTILILKRYDNLLPTDICENIYNILLKYHVNPLKSVYFNENCIEFMIKEHEVVKVIDAKKQKGKKKGGKKKSSSKKSSKKSAKNRKNASNMDEIKDILLQTTRNVLIKRVKSEAVSYLYLFIKEDIQDEELLNALGKFLTPKFVLNTLQLFINSKKIELDDNTIDLSKTLIQFVKDCNLSKDDDVTIDSLNLLNVSKNKENFKKYIELDKEQSIYKVCFHCCRKIDKLLFACPICGLIYFCSQQCNILNNKIKNNVHPCRVLFYNNEKAYYEDCLKNGVPYIGRNKLQNAQDVIKEKWLLEEMKKEKHLRKMEEKKKLERDRLRQGKFGEEYKKGKSRGHGSSSSGRSGSSKRGRGKKGGESDTMGGKKKSRYGEGDGVGDGVGKKGKGKKTGKEGEGGEDGEEGREGREGREGKEGRGKRKGGKGSDATGDSKGRKRGKDGRGGKGGKDGRGGKGASGKSSSGRGKGKVGDGTKKSGSTNREGSRASDQSGVIRKTTTYDLTKIQSSLHGGHGFSSKDSDQFDRLPPHYQYFMKKLLALFPDIDLSSLLLPYACYKDGELYYRFIENKYICSTYSHV